MVIDMKLYARRRHAEKRTRESSLELAVIDYPEDYAKKFPSDDKTFIESILADLQRYKEETDGNTKKQKRLLSCLPSKTEVAREHRAGNRSEM